MSAAAKKLRIFRGVTIVHPVDTPDYRAKLTLGHRRITEADVPQFKGKLEGYYNSIKNESCFDSKSRRSVPICNCLKNLLEDASNRTSLAQVVCSHWNLNYHARKILVEQKIKHLVDFQIQKRKKKVGKKGKNIKTKMVYLKGQLFILNLGSENIETSRNVVSLCRHSWQKLFGLGHNKIDKIKDEYSNKPNLLLITHGNSNEVGSRSLAIKKAEMSLALFFDSLRDEGEEYASRKVRARLGPTYFRDNEDNLNLPPH